VNDPVRPERRKTRRPASTTAPLPQRATTEDESNPSSTRSNSGSAVGPVTDHAAVIRRARSKAGGGGAILAGAMLGLRDVLSGPKKEQIAVVVDAPTEPIDLDEHGIQVDIDDTRVSAPALPPLPEAVLKPKRRKRG
jgi:hypothetical protein